VNDQIEHPSTRTLGRRAVVRTAAHAAWAVPAIQLVTSVDANAAVCSANTSAPTHYTVTGSTTTDGVVSFTAHGRYTVTNSGKAGTAILIIAVSGITLSTAPVISGWTPPVLVSAGRWRYTAAIGACGSLAANFDKSVVSLLGSWTATVTP